MSERVSARLVGAAALVATIALWQVAATARWINPVLVPAPSTIVLALKTMILNAEIVSPFLHTVLLFAVGYSIACAAGIAIGLWMGWSAAAYRLLEPLIELLRPIPKSALVPALFLFLGIGKVTMVTVVVFATFFPVLINTLQGVKGIDPVLLDTARTFRCANCRMLRSVILPAASPSILAGMKVGLGLGMVLVVLAEMLAGETGLGFKILDTQRSFQSSDMYAWIAILAALGASLAVLFDGIERRFAPWRGK